MPRHRRERKPVSNKVPVAGDAETMFVSNVKETDRPNLNHHHKERSNVRKRTES